MDLVVVTDRLEVFKNSLKIKKGRDLGTNAINSERRQWGRWRVEQSWASENIIYIMRNAISAVVGFVGSAWQWLLSVFLILVLLLRIVPLLDFIGNFEAFRDTILNKEVSAVVAFDPVRNDPAVCLPLGLLFQQFRI